MLEHYLIHKKQPVYARYNKFAMIEVYCSNLVLMELSSQSILAFSKNAEGYDMVIASRT